MLERHRIEFESCGERCAGFIYGGGGRAKPCIVMAHGFGGTQEGALARNAADFAAAGFRVLTFDYRGFGESDGARRQVVDIKAQHADWRAAIVYARSRPDVSPDRVALWGSSLGGGHALAIAAEDSRLAAVIAQVPFNGFPKRVKHRTARETRRLLSVAVVDWIGQRMGRPARYIKAVAPPGELAVMASDEAAETIAMMDNPTWRNEIGPGVLIDMAVWYRPGRQARRLTMPVLLSLAAEDRESPAAATRPIALRAPKGELRQYPCSHFQFYHDAVRPIVLADQISFLRCHLIGFGDAGA